jgi:hypothetical protein
MGAAALSSVPRATMSLVPAKITRRVMMAVAAIHVSSWPGRAFPEPSCDPEYRAKRVVRASRVMRRTPADAAIVGTRTATVSLDRRLERTRTLLPPPSGAPHLGPTQPTDTPVLRAGLTGGEAEGSERPPPEPRAGSDKMDGTPVRGKCLVPFH